MTAVLAACIVGGFALSIPVIRALRRVQLARQRRNRRVYR